MSSLLSGLVWKDDGALAWRTVWIGAAGLLTLVPISYVLRYQQDIKRRLRAVEDELSKPLMVRDIGEKDDETVSQRQARREIRCLELNPAFVEQHKKEWNLVSLGEYLSSLHPCLPESEDGAVNNFIQREIEATIGTVLLRALGRRFGGAILPLLGITDVHSRTASIATSIASWWVSHFMVHANVLDDDRLHDVGSLPLNLNEIVSLANMNEKFVSSMMEIKSLEWMRRGEIGYDPSFGKPLPQDDEVNENTKDANKEEPDLIPNPFIVSEHWDKAIEGLEKLIMSQDVVKERQTPNATEEKEQESTATYDPHSRDFPPPTPINARLLPDLHMGWGHAKCTHTKREIIRNRLLCVLLNKLSYNFYKKEQKETDLFTLQMTPTSKPVWFPHAFLQELMEAGHVVEMCPRSTITSFGLAVCIQEADGSFSNVPIGIFLRSGYEKSDSSPAHYIMPHGGMDLQLAGPLVGNGRCNIQFYMAIEGMCGWHSNHNADVPWLQSNSSTSIYTKEEALLAMKLAGILAVTFNALGTEMDLPYGGYGIVGVCNDTAALLDYGVRGETNMFPLVSTGRFMIHSSRRLIRLYNNIKDTMEGGKKFGDDIRRLITACCKIDSDLQASPANLISSSKRFLASQPETLCFQIEQESKTIMTTLMEVFDEFDQKLSELSMSVVRGRPHLFGSTV